MEKGNIQLHDINKTVIDMNVYVFHSCGIDDTEWEIDGAIYYILSLKLRFEPTERVKNLILKYYSFERSVWDADLIRNDAYNLYRAVDRHPFRQLWSSGQRIESLTKEWNAKEKEMAIYKDLTWHLSLDLFRNRNTK